MTAELLTQGAGARTAQQVAEDIEFVGGSLEGVVARRAVHGVVRRGRTSPPGSACSTTSW